MKTKLALLSNVNMNFVIRMLKKDFEVYDGEGYGNELGIMLDANSSYHAYKPQITFLVMDLMEVIGHDFTEASQRIEKWFAMLEGCLQPKQLYYISDAYLWGPQMAVVADCEQKPKLEALWREALQTTCKAHTNVHVFPYHELVEKLGEENVFSLKTWYMGRILHTNEAQKRISAKIGELVRLQNRTPKKVLLLDLDNTLWGGLAGEADHTPVELSEEHSGLAYKNQQRVISQMQKQGVLLGIVSKNNEEDAMEILKNHPHMVLRPEHFAIKKINWSSKQENIIEIAQELNLGTDSFVFWDDNPAERELIKVTLPEVEVPDFPEKPEELAPAMVQIYHEFFEKAFVTKEDMEKTQQYEQNAQRNRLKEQTGSFDLYLQQLDMVVSIERPDKNADRLLQLVNKTNQFNLTTKRYDAVELQQMLQNDSSHVYLYRVKDCFGDNGIVAAVIVNISLGIPEIETFVMSCRVMGKNIEYAIVEDVENRLQKEGFLKLRATYLPTSRNKPVENLFEKLGYSVLAEHEGRKEYEMTLQDRPARVYYAKIEE